MLKSQVQMDEAALAAHSRTSQAQGYPSYFARLALAENHAGVAAACAVNQPAWGRMCRRLSAALSSRSYGYDGPGTLLLILCPVARWPAVFFMGSKGHASSDSQGTRG